MEPEGIFAVWRMEEPFQYNFPAMVCCLSWSCPPINAKRFKHQLSISVCHSLKGMHLRATLFLELLYHLMAKSSAVYIRQTWIWILVPTYIAIQPWRTYLFSINLISPTVRTKCNNVCETPNLCYLLPLLICQNNWYMSEVMSWRPISWICPSPRSRCLAHAVF